MRRLGGDRPEESTYRPLLDLPSEALGNVLHAIASNAINHRLRVGHHNRDTLPLHLGPQEATRTELVHLIVLHTVQVQRNPKPSIPRPISPPQHRRIVSSNLGMPRPVRRRAVKLVKDKALDGVNTVVNPRGHHIHAEHVLLGRRQPQLRARPVNLRPHVHGRARLMRGHELGVEPHGSAAGGDEEVLGDGGHRRDGGGVLHAGGVLVRAEDLEAGVAGGAEGLEALVGLLAVVEGGGHAVDADVGVGDELEGGPLARLLGPVGLDVAVDWGLWLLVGEVWG